MRRNPKGAESKNRLGGQLDSGPPFIGFPFRPRFGEVGIMLDRFTYVAVVLGLAACGKSQPGSGPDSGEPPNSLEEDAPTLRPVDPPAERFEIADGLLSDPILQLPTEDSVHVVWYTGFAGSEQALILGSEKRVIMASSARLSRMLEDGDSQIPESVERQLGKETDVGVRERGVYRHVAVANGLKAGERIPYQVECVDDSGKRFRSETFTLQPLPSRGQAVSILLTSDQQNQPMSAANYQKVEETAGPLDAVY